MDILLLKGFIDIAYLKRKSNYLFRPFYLGRHQFEVCHVGKNYTICDNKCLVSNEISFSAITFLVRLNINLLTHNDHYSGRTAPVTSKRCILYIYSTNIGTEYFKHGIYSPFFSPSSKCSLFHKSNVFGSCVIHILYTGCAKIKKIIPAPKV